MDQKGMTEQTEELEEEKSRNRSNINTISWKSWKSYLESQTLPKNTKPLDQKYLYMVHICGADTYVLCNKCHNNLCLTHITPESHNCMSLYPIYLPPHDKILRIPLNDPEASTIIESTSSFQFVRRAI
jgi:hypothetical protein